jgi:protease-4
MGNYAASGGYYISCNANTIFAEATTITGSIGVFGALPNFQEAATKLGITTQKVSTHDNPGDYSPFLPLTEKQRTVMTEGVESIYKTFITRVAVGRKMNTAQVDSIAQGRVWSGTDALKIGLVDKIGGMDDALKEAAKLAKISKYRIINFPEYEKSFDDVLAKFGLAQSKEALLKEELGPENYAAFQRLKQLQQLKGIQALMPYELNIK